MKVPGRKIVVTGAAGAGKTTFARKLCEITGLPVYHMDSIIYKSGWKKASKAEIDEKLVEIFETDNWIIDGVSKDVYDQADTIVFLDFPTSLCFLRAIKRMFTQRRNELPEDLKETDAFWLLVKLTFLFPKVTRPKILSYKTNSDKEFVHIRNGRDLKAFLTMFETKVSLSARVELVSS